MASKSELRAGVSRELEKGVPTESTVVFFGKSQLHPLRPSSFAAFATLR